MSTLSLEFQKAATSVNSLTERPTDKQLLQLYGLYKQATVGDCNTTKPSFINIKESSKWNSWTERKGLSKEDAMKKYVNVVNQICK